MAKRTKPKSVQDDIATPAKPKRGRPRRSNKSDDSSHLPPPLIQGPLNSVSPDNANLTPRKRGRPRNNPSNIPVSKAHRVLNKKNKKTLYHKATINRRNQLINDNVLDDADATLHFGDYFDKKRGYNVTARDNQFKRCVTVIVYSTVRMKSQF